MKAAGVKTAVNGKFDAQTTAAVREYQRAKGFQVDGVVGQQTWGSFIGESYPPGSQMLAGASRPHTHETSGLGAAICSAVALGLHPDFATAVSRMTRGARTFEPVRAQAELYDQLYRQVYRRMYSRLGPLYASLRRITGYPPPD